MKCRWHPVDRPVEPTRPDDRRRRHPLTHRDRLARQVVVRRLQSVGVTDDDAVAIGAAEAPGDHDAVAGGVHRGAAGDAEVRAVVQLAGTGDRMDPRPERGRDGSADRPAQGAVAGRAGRAGPEPDRPGRRAGRATPRRAGRAGRGTTRTRAGRGADKQWRSVNPCLEGVRATSPASTVSPRLTPGSTGWYVDRSRPWSTVTTPTPATDPANVTRPAGHGSHGLADPAGQVDAPMARAVLGVGEIECAGDAVLVLGIVERPGPRAVAAPGRCRGRREDEERQGDGAGKQHVLIPRRGTWRRDRHRSSGWGDAALTGRLVDFVHRGPVP